MARKYGGAIRRTGRRKGRARLVSKTRAPTSMVARPGLNVSAAKSARFFASLPKMMRLKTSWYADTNYFHLVSTPAQTVYTGYWWIDPLRYDYNVNALGVGANGTNSRANRNWFGTEMESMFLQYSEGRFRTHVLSAEFACDYQRSANNTSPAYDHVSTQVIPTVQIVCAPVPQSFIRNTAGTVHLITESGVLVMGGPDYFSALTKMPGATTKIIPANGNATAPTRFTMTIDGYEHNGNLQSVTATRTWAPGDIFPTLTVTHPAPDQRQVYLFAIRHRTPTTANVVCQINLRASFRLDQHMEFMDKVPLWPYMATNTSN